MRVSTVCLAASRPAHRMNVPAKLNTPKNTISNSNLEKSDALNVNFGRSVKWGGIFGLVAGTAAGIGLTVLTGGAAAGIIPILSGGCGIAGDCIDAKVSDDYPKTDDSSYDDTYGIEYYS